MQIGVVARLTEGAIAVFQVRRRMGLQIYQVPIVQGLDFRLNA
jgi:hypothetical protein